MSTPGERIALIWATALVAVVFLLQNPLMPGSVRLDFGQVCQGADYTPGGSDGVGECFPGLHNTGVPSGTSLTAYSGPMTITTNGTTIDAKTISGTLDIQASGVVITNSLINGTVSTDNAIAGRSFTITDSEVHIGESAGTGIGARDYTATRVEVTGGNRSIWCWLNCTITDSYVHDQFTDPSGFFHESGLRVGASTTVIHNTLACDAPDVPPDGGCSAPQTGYGDGAAVEDVLLEDNLYIPTTGGVCSYLGASPGHEFTDDTNNVVSRDNIFTRAVINDHSNLDCAFFFTTDGFDEDGPGNEFTNNRYDSRTGTLVVPNSYFGA